MPITEMEAVAALPPDGWVRRYVIHAAKQTTAPLVYHIGVGITLMAVTCPLAYGMHYAGTLRTNQFTLLVGRSGEDNKSSALGVGREILDAAAPPLIGDFPGSPEGLIESLQNTPSQMIPISEFGKFLSSAQRGYFEPTKTLLADVWDCLDSETEILSVDGWKKNGELNVGDFVWSMDTATGKLVRSMVVDVRSRPLRPDERMVELKGHLHDVRVTEGHRIYTKDRYEKRAWRETKAGQMVDETSTFKLPFSAEPSYTFTGVPLTNDELRFVAWSITDSSFKSTTLRISQTDQKCASRIRDLLTRLGLDFTETEEKRNEEKEVSYKRYKRNSPLRIFSVPKGTHNGSMARNGWFKYADYMDDSLSPLLLNMSDAQFRVFWHELLLGDGEQVGREDQPLKGLLWSVNKTLIDRLQVMAVVRGYSAQYGSRELPSGKIAYRMSISEKRLVATSPLDARSVRFAFSEPKPNEVVWCATTEHGTLVTRRNGKVIILGNCGAIQRIKANNKTVRVEDPRLSIAAACSIPYLEKHTLAEDWTGGFMGRWLVLYGRRERHDPDPVGDRSDFQWLVDELRQRALTPQAGWCMGLEPNARQMWNHWYQDVMTRQLPSNIIGIRARAPTIARKIALAYAWDFGPAIHGKPWKIDVDVLEPAIAAAELHIRSLTNLSDVIAEHADARMRRAVLVAINEKGGVATLGEVLHIMKMRKRPVVETLEALIEEKVIRLTTCTLSGGPCYTII